MSHLVIFRTTGKFVNFSIKICTIAISPAHCQIEDRHDPSANLWELNQDLRFAISIPHNLSSAFIGASECRSWGA